VQASVHAGCTDEFTCSPSCMEARRALRPEHSWAAALKLSSQLAPGQDALQACFPESFINNARAWRSSLFPSALLPWCFASAHSQELVLHGPWASVLSGPYGCGGPCRAPSQCAVSLLLLSAPAWLLNRRPTIRGAAAVSGMCAQSRVAARGLWKCRKVPNPALSSEKTSWWWWYLHWRTSERKIWRNNAHAVLN
jgi:hypothetical protein